MNDRVRRISDRIQAASEAKFKISIDEKKSEVHAQAFSDKGEIVLTKGAAEKLTDDELAWVIGHEVAHIENEDAGRIMEATQKFREKVEPRLRKWMNECKQRGEAS